MTGAQALSQLALVYADVGSTVRVEVTGTNGIGSTAASAVTAVVTGTPPSNTVPPTISGTPQDGQTLTLTNGSWSGDAPFTYTYQWQRCDSAGNNCTDIPGATGSTYALTSDDVGSTVRGVVTATNSGGSATSATVRAMTPLVASPAQSSPSSGPLEIRPRDGFNPTTPQHDAGIRIDPPPSPP